MANYRVQWPPFTANIKGLAIVLFTLWFASVMVDPLGDFVGHYMLVSQRAVIEEFQVWTLLTYSLWHADFMHLLFNVLVLWLFGGEIARRWDSVRWWRFNALCALGGGVAVVLSQLARQTFHPTLGYSGAVMGVVAAFAWQNWNSTIHLFFFPMKGKTLLLVFIALDIFIVVVGREPISVAAHLGGMATGLLIVSDWWRPRRWKLAHKRYKHKKRRKKFQLLQKDPESDRYLN
jgi:membrane associated rhomboid family serine protease